MTVVLRFKLDENMPAAAKGVLSAAGHDVETVVDEQLAGAADAQVYEAAGKEDRILVTIDLDFADILTYPPAQGRGIWVLRSASQDGRTLVQLLDQALVVAASETAHGKLWIVEAGRVRIRS